MKKLPIIAPEILAFLQAKDTCTVSNAIETFNIRMRNEGYITGAPHCLTPKLSPIAGYAVTAKMRASAPPVTGLCYYERSDWWQYVAGIPEPKILVVEDIDRVPGAGALFGEIHARIARALGCAAYVTNGVVRDLGAIHAMGFQCFARGAVVSHSYAHITEWGLPVEIGGLQIKAGDLLHGDCNGVHSVPLEVLDRLPDAVARIEAHEAELIALCGDPKFTFAKLEEALRESRKWSPGLESH